MAAPITVFEHEYTRGLAWSDRELGVMERLNRSVGTDILTPVFRSGQRELKAQQHVGVVRFANRTVQILPKIHRTENADDRDRCVREATHNLLHMLAYAGPLPVREHLLAPLLRQGN